MSKENDTNKLSRLTVLFLNSSVIAFNSYHNKYIYNLSNRCTNFYFLIAYTIVQRHCSDCIKLILSMLWECQCWGPLSQKSVFYKMSVYISVCNVVGKTILSISTKCATNISTIMAIMVILEGLFKVYLLFVQKTHTKWLNFF